MVVFVVTLVALVVVPRAVPHAVRSVPSGARRDTTPILQRVEAAAAAEQAADLALARARDAIRAGNQRRVLDTLSLTLARDSAEQVLIAARLDLGRARIANQALDERVAEARDTMTENTSLPAMLAAAVVLGVAAGFGVTFAVELRHPRIADAAEAAALAAAPVLATIGPSEPAPTQRRRRADREVPPLIDQGSDAYWLLYSQLADRGFNLPLAAVVGDEPTVTATVAANLAATVARQVRTTIVMDLDFESDAAAAVLRVRPAPGIADVLAGRIEWPEAIASVVVGRGRNMDVLPSGVSSAANVRAAPSAIDDGSTILRHVARRYECVIVSAPRSRQGSIPPLGEAAQAVVVCVRVARTPIAVLQQLVTTLRAQGASVRGLVVWEREDPSLTIGSAHSDR